MTTSSLTKINSNLRLHSVLRALSNSRGVMPAYVALATCLALEEENQNEMAMKTSAVMYRMIAVAEREVRFYLDDELDFYLPVFDRLRAVFNPNGWQVQWDQKSPQLLMTDVLQISNTGQVLRKRAPECELRNDDLDSIRASVESLKQIIDESQIESVLKHKLKRRCAAVLEAVEDYRFWGVEGIELSFEAAVGAVGPLAEKTSSGAWTERWQQTVKCLLAISSALALANTGYKSAHDSISLLEDGIQAAKTLAGPIIDSVR